MRGRCGPTGNSRRLCAKESSRPSAMRAMRRRWRSRRSPRPRNMRDHARFPSQRGLCRDREGGVPPRRRAQIRLLRRLGPNVLGQRFCAIRRLRHGEEAAALHDFYAAERGRFPYDAASDDYRGRRGGLFRRQGILEGGLSDPKTRFPLGPPFCRREDGHGPLSEQHRRRRPGRNWHQGPGMAFLLQRLVVRRLPGDGKPCLSSGRRGA